MAYGKAMKSRSASKPAQKATKLTPAQKKLPMALQKKIMNAKKK